jgi:radical SAM protein
MSTSEVAATMPSRSRRDLDQAPMLVFWESTKACLLSCRHCRASAISCPMAGELDREDAAVFLDALAGFGSPGPVLVVTGGDVLMRDDLLALVDRATELGLPLAVAPSVTPLLTSETLSALRQRGVKAASISLDGATPSTHEGIRQVEGHFEATLSALRLLREHGFTVQVNTLVMRENVHELADIAWLVAESGASIWELFFLVQVGRGSALEELSPAENEDVCHFLFDASRYGFVVRTVEAPFFRRVVAWRKDDPPGADPRRAYGLGPLYTDLAGRLRALLGEPSPESHAHVKGTRDGKGIVFVSHDGEIFPAGFLPYSLGNVKRDDIVEVYRSHPVLKQIRASRFSGRCGVCEYADLCGGSRSRAFSSSGDPLGEDPACAYVPGSGAPRIETRPRLRSETPRRRKELVT